MLITEKPETVFDTSEIKAGYLVFAKTGHGMRESQDLSQRLRTKRLWFSTTPESVM